MYEINKLDRLSLYESRKLYDSAWNTNYGNESEIIVKLEYIWEKRGKLQELRTPIPTSTHKPIYQTLKKPSNLSEYRLYNHMGGHCITNFHKRTKELDLLEEKHTENNQDYFLNR